MKHLLTPFVFVVCFTPIHAQKKSFEIGGKLINELVSWKAYGPGAGLQAIWRITPHSGIESGIYYKQNPKYFLFQYSLDSYENRKYKEHDIMLPVMYRYDSKTINFTAGFALDYFLNLGTLQKEPPPGLMPDWLERWEVVSTISISRNFYLKKDWILEPEIRASSFVPAGGGGVGLNLSFRKKLF